MAFKRKTSSDTIRKIGFKVPRKPSRKGLKRLGLIFMGLVLIPHIYAISLKFAPVPGTILMKQRAAQGEDVRTHWTSLDDISPTLVYAVIGAEDSRFCEHKGVDWKAVQTVIDERENTGRKRGGSTITQQTAKNVFLWNGGGWLRKLPETWAALFIDTVWGKRRVMEVYLNVAEWGDGIFGAEAASNIRFQKSARDLTSQEAALLAAVLPSPNKWRLDPPGPYVRNRANGLVNRSEVVRQNGYANCVFKLGK